MQKKLDVSKNKRYPSKQDEIKEKELMNPRKIQKIEENVFPDPLSPPPPPPHLLLLPPPPPPPPVVKKTLYFYFLFIC